MESNEENKQPAELSNDETVQSPELETAIETDGVEETVSEDEIASLSKEQLAAKLDEYLAQEEQPMADIIRMIKSRFDVLVKEERRQKLEAYIQDGGVEAEYTPLADSLENKVEDLYKVFSKKRADQRRKKEKSLVENLATKNLIIEELKVLIKGEESFSKSYQKFQTLQSKWRSTGNVPAANMNNLRESYHFLTGKFYDMVKISNELRELDKKINLEHKTELCLKAELLAEETSLKKSLDGLTLLMEAWRETGHLNKELGDPLWQRFKTATDKIYKKKKENTAKLKQQQEANLAAKTALCEQLEALATTDLTSHKLRKEASEKVEAIWALWQKTGFVPKKDNGNCWKRFKKARQNFHDAQDVFYASQRQEFGGNLQKKIELCEKAESLKDSTDWMGTAEILKKLQSQWKDIGQVSRKDSEATWNRFRKACDLFFENKAKHHASKDNALKANVTAREALIAKFSLVLVGATMQECIDEMKKIQEEWDTLGEVPLRDSERLNNSLGKATEQYLERVKESGQVDVKLFHRLKYDQMLKSPAGVEQIKKERFVLQDKIKKLQADANKLETNLSFFGKSKNTNPLIAEYREQLEVVNQQVKVLTDQLKTIPVIKAPVEIEDPKKKKKGNQQQRW